MSKERTESNFANPEESNFLDPEKVKQCAEKLAVMLLKLCQKRQQSSTFESSGLDQTDVDGAFKLVVEIFCEAKVTTCIDRKKVSDALLVEFQTQSEYCSMVVDVIFKEVPISSYGPFEMLEKNTNHRLRKIKQIIKTKFSSELNPPAPQWVTFLTLAINFLAIMAVILAILAAATTILMLTLPLTVAIEVVFISLSIVMVVGGIVGIISELSAPPAESLDVTVGTTTGVVTEPGVKVPDEEDNQISPTPPE